MTDSITGIYLDNQGSTPIDPRVKEVMDSTSDKVFANPHAGSHYAGIAAAQYITTARRQVARAINADARSIIFTSGATEANNLAILGVASAAANGRKHIITLATEHSSVIQPICRLRERHFQTVALPVLSSGLVDLEALASEIGSSTLLVSVMHVNNETGVVQPIKEIAQLCHREGALLHSDCAQSLGKISIDVIDMDVDLLTLSSHKAYGPKGVGALYVRRQPAVPIDPIMFGGGQEQSLRPGTLPVPLCVGFGEACQIAESNLTEDSQRISELANRLISGITNLYPKTRLNGCPTHLAPGSFNMCFPGSSSEHLLDAFQGVYLSSGSACTSTTVEPSRILTAYGLSTADADSSLRFGIGRFTTKDEVERAIGIIGHGLRQLGLMERPYLNFHKSTGD